MFSFDTDSVPSGPASPGGWAAPSGDDPASPWPARPGFLTGGPAAPARPGAPGDAPSGHRPGGDGVQAARLDEEDDFEEDFLDDEDDDEELDDGDVYDDEELDDEEDDLLDDDDDEEFDFEDD